MNFLLQLTGEDRDYLPFLKPLLAGHSVSLNDSTPVTITEVEMRAKSKNTNLIGVTNPRFLSRLLGTLNERKQPSLDNYAGSIIQRNGFEYLILNPLKQFVTLPYAKFLFQRYFSKFIRPDSWFPTPAFSWEVATPARLPSLYDDFSTADLIAVDIETVKTDLAITCSGYCGIWFDPASRRIRFHSIVIPCTEEYELAWIGKFNTLPIPKIFQNGKYDNAYFARWGVPISHWRYDTITMFHSWYSELPKDLAFIVSFMVRAWEFWKSEKDVPIYSYEYYRYNAKDTFTTALSCLALLWEMPEWARLNYLKEFPVNFPCHAAELTGIKRHEQNFTKLRDGVEEQIADKVAKLRADLGEPNFNSNSPPQCVRLWKVLGSGDITSSDTPSRDTVKNRHPLNAYIVEQIEDLRKDRKLFSSYLKDGITLDGRILYQLNPHGTDTGRLASKESHFWCGLQIHNIPIPKKKVVYKSIFVADDGFEIGEADGAQAEARDTAHITGDLGYLAAVTGTRDFHSVNCAAFFGVPYEKIYDDEKKEVIDDLLRWLSKRVNHGANYNMQWRVLLDTMGIKNVLRARELLKLSKNWTLRQICEHLLDCFDKAYPVIRGDYHDWIKYQVATHGKLVGPQGWTRHCFYDPSKSKQSLNAYVAHCPQSSNAMRLNEAFLRVFYEVYLPNPSDFKLLAQIHDSILFQFRIGRIDLVRRVRECMDIPTTVTDIRGITRTFRVPVDIKTTIGQQEKTWANVKKFKEAA